MSEPTPPMVCLYCRTPLGNDETSHCGALRLRVEELQQERDHWKRAFEELTPEDIRGMAIEANALLEQRVEELTHERDQARQAEAHYLREWLTTSYELGEARQARWIPVSESIPEVFRRCLTWHEPKAGCCRGVQISTFYEDGWAEVHDCAPSYDQPKLTHWMPLPEPPK